jgi:hypothetical protein
MEGYAEGQEPNTGDSYADYIKEKWVKTSEHGEDVRFNILSKNYEAETLYYFITGLCNLLVQLKPKIQGRKLREAGLEAKFIDFHKKYASDPQKILDIQKDKVNLEDAETRKQTIFEMEDTVRSVIEELGITEWGK